MNYLASLVDADYYLSVNLDVAIAGLEPVQHYLENGWREDRPPNPLFDFAFYKKQVSDSLTIPVLAHYLKFGSAAGLTLHPLFDRNYYLQRYPAVIEIGIDPFIYFVVKGGRDLHSPHPLFDANFYAVQLGTDRSNMANPLCHFVLTGWKQGVDPHPLFDTAHYLSQAAPYESINIPALVHYVLYGATAGRSPHLWFDPVYYCEQAGLVADPLQHFLLEGWRVGYNPHPKFNTRYYLDQNPDVDVARINPLIHFILRGAEEGRSPCPEYSRAFMLAHKPETDQPCWRVVMDTPAIPASSLVDFLSWRYEGCEFKWMWSDPRLKPEFDDPARPSIRTLNTLVTEINDLARLLKTRRKVNVSIIVPAHNKLIHTLACLRSILYAGSRYSFEVLVADDASSDATPRILAKLTSPIFKVFSNGSAQGFLRNCNSVAAQAEGDWLVLLNNDTIVLPGWLDELIDTLVKNLDIGLVGAKLLYPDGSLQECGGVVWRDGNAWNIGRSQDPRMPIFSYQREVDYCSGAAIAVPRSLWESLGGFDDRYSPAYYEDTDLAFRVATAGYRVVVQPLAGVVHFEGISHGKELSSGIKRYQEINRGTFLKRWKDTLSQHPRAPKAVNYEAFEIKKKTILVIDAETPRPDQDSGSNDTFQYIRALLQFGYHVIFVAQNCLYLGRYTQDLQRLGVECHYAPYSLSLPQVVKEQGARLAAVLVFRHYVANDLLPSLKAYAPGAKVVLQTVDLHFLRETRQAALTKERAEIDRAERTKQEELAVIEQVDATILLSHYEMRVVHKLRPEARLHCIPILRETPPLFAAPSRSRKGLMFLGGFRHPPNLDGIHWFVEQVWPLLLEKGFKDKLMIVGSDPPVEIKRLESRNIQVLGYVESLDSVFARCRATIAPLRYGAGLKGKIISSLSYGVPCISTPIGVEGSGLRAGQHVLVGNDAKEIAAQILRLYADDALWMHLAQNGRKYFDKRFSTQAVFPKIRKLFRELGV